MLLGILETGRVNDQLINRHGDYPSMFGALFKAADPSVETRTWPVLDGVLPESPEDCDAWLVTGSKFGVYDPEPWIDPLKDFLRAVRAARVPLIGVCFGHQIMAEAFGGRAEKSAKGWGCGVHAYRFETVPAWISKADDRFEVHAMHQDQVTAIPEDATVLASSPFCEFAMLSYGDPELPDAISIQPHPEFGTDYARDLVALRTGNAIPESVGTEALSTFGRPVVATEFAEWCLAFISQARSRTAAA